MSESILKDRESPVLSVLDKYAPGAHPSKEKSTNIPVLGFELSTATYFNMETMAEVMVRLLFLLNSVSRVIYLRLSQNVGEQIT